MGGSRLYLRWMLSTVFVSLIFTQGVANAQNSTSSTESSTTTPSVAVTQDSLNEQNSLSLSSKPKNSLRIGYINANVLINDAPQGQIAYALLEEEFAERKAELEAMEMNLEQMANDLEVEEDPDERTKLEKNLRLGNREFERGRLDYEEDFNFRRNEELTNLQNFISEVILKLAKDQEFDLIVQEPVVWASDEIDITDEILNILDELRKKAESQ